MGDIHSHGAYDKNYKGEDFSPNDIEGSDSSGTVGFLVTPGGKLKKYDPKTRQTRTISSDMPKDPNFPHTIRE